LEQEQSHFFTEWKKMSKKIIIDISDEISGNNAQNESKA